MKLSLLASISILSTAAAFAPARTATPTSSSTALRGITGEEARAAHGSFAPGHFETLGSRGPAIGRTACDGEEVRAARASYAKPGYGEIGSDGLPRRQPIPTAGYSTSFAPGQFETHSSSGTGGGDYSLPAAAAAPAAAAPRAASPKKSYGLGSWKA